MATFFVTHHKFPTNPKLFTVNIDRVVKRVGEPNTEFYFEMRGEEFWELYVATDALDASGEAIPAFWADIIIAEQDIDELVADKVQDICALIDWTNDSELVEQQDTLVPRLVSVSPLPGATDVSITAPIKIVVTEPLPGSGLDLSTISLKVKGIPVTPVVTGNPYEYTIEFSPKPVF